MIRTERQGPRKEPCLSTNGKPYRLEEILLGSNPDVVDQNRGIVDAVSLVR